MRGFTLMDVLVAIVVMTIGLVGLLAMQMASISANARTRELVEATYLAQEKIEVLRRGPLPIRLPTMGVPAECEQQRVALGWGGPAFTGGEIIDSRGCILSGGIEQRAYCQPPHPPGTRFTRTWRVDTFPNWNRFEVCVGWTTPDGRPHATVVSHVR